MEYLGLSTGQASKQRYKFPMQAYLTFCELYNLKPAIANKEERHLQLERFTVWRTKFLQGTSGTAMTDISAIQKWLQYQGISSNIKKENKQFKSLVKAIEKIKPKKSKTTRPLEEWEIRKIEKEMKPTSIDAIVIRAVWAFALVTAMRPSEYLAEKVRDDSELRKQLYVRKERIFIWEPKKKSKRKHFGVVWFFKSKTNQSYEKEFATITCKCNIGFCPIVELKRLLDIIKDPKPNTAIFTWENGNYVTAREASKYLKDCAKRVKIDWERISAYSLKKACITSELKEGLPDTIAVQLARWKNFHSIRPYINLGPRQLIEARSNKRKQVEKDRFRIGIKSRL